MLFEKIKEYSEKELFALANESTKITYKELYKKLAENQALLRMNGFCENDTVVLKITNQVHYVIVFLSLLSIPCWVVPVPSNIMPGELENVLADTDGKLFDDSTYSSFESCGGTPADLQMPNPEMGGIYHLTSGSTGKSKLCVRTVKHLSIEGECFRREFGLEASESIISASPVYHSFALGAALMTAFMSGCLLYVVDNFAPRQILRMIHNNKINILIMVPAMARALCNTYTKQNYSLESVRIALVGAGPVTKDLYETIKDKFGITLFSNYGSTETGGIISRLVPMPYKSIGKPMKGVKVKLCDSSHNVVGTGEEGEVWVKGTYMMQGYLGEEKSIYDEDGFFNMGDLAYMDEGGFLYITGRTKLLINIGGKKVNPYEVEKTILKHPAVEECAVTGFVKENGEECVKATIVASVVTEEQIYDFCSKYLNKHQCPTVIEFAEKLPRNSLGKILRDVLTKNISEIS